MSGAALAVPEVRYPSRWEWEQRFRDSHLPTRTIVTGLAMATYASADGTNVRPSIERVAANTGQSRSTVKRAVRELKQYGWLKVVRQGGRTGKVGAEATEHRLTLGRAKTTRGQLAKFRELLIGKGAGDVVVLDEPAFGLPAGTVLVGGPPDQGLTGDPLVPATKGSSDDTKGSSQVTKGSSGTDQGLTGDPLPVQDQNTSPEQDHTRKPDPLVMAAIREAPTESKVKKIAIANRAVWTDEHRAAAKARIAELEGQDQAAKVKGAVGEAVGAMTPHHRDLLLRGEIHDSPLLRKILVAEHFVELGETTRDQFLTESEKIANLAKSDELNNQARDARGLREFFGI